MMVSYFENTSKKGFKLSIENSLSQKIFEDFFSGIILSILPFLMTITVLSVVCDTHIEIDGLTTTELIKNAFLLLGLYMSCYTLVTLIVGILFARIISHRNLRNYKALKRLQRVIATILMWFVATQYSHIALVFALIGLGILIFSYIFWGSWLSLKSPTTE